MLLLTTSAVIAGMEKPLPYNTENLSYFHDSEKINEMAIRYAKNLQRYYIYYAKFNVVQAQSKLDEIDEYITTGEIKTNSRQSNTFVTPFYGKYEYHSEGPTQDDVLGDSPERLYKIDINDLTVDKLLEYQELLSKAISQYNMTEDYLLSADDFHFSLYSTKLEHIIATNSEGFYNEGSYDAVSLDDKMFDVIFNGETISSSFEKNNLKCQISIPTTTSSEVMSYMLQLQHKAVLNSILSTPLLSLALYLTAVALSILLLCFSRKSLLLTIHKVYRHYERLPIFIKFPILFFSIKFVIVNNRMGAAYITNMIINANVLKLAILVIQTFCAVVVFFLTIKHFIRVFVKPWRFKREPEYRFICETHRDFAFMHKSKRHFTNLLYILSLFFILLFNSLVYISLFAYYSMPNADLIYVLLVCLIISWMLINKALISEIKLRYYITEMADGRIERLPRQRGLFTNTINRLNDINSRLKQNMENTLRGERLKTELITNVSHDLKTPLTSIINYVDLIKELDLDNEKAREYIDIIDKKSSRLKILIEDLFEASKLSSGQMELEMHRSDIVALLRQTMGELSDRMEEAGITFKVTAPETPVIINMDGQKMWRVFDNMFNNILKYSPEGSRAYVDVKDNPRNVTITLKNVANYQMDFDANDLFERFKRGDKARTTEGSGLGLSIAKGIVELHGGKISIVTDGDLFKMIIKLYK